MLFNSIEFAIFLPIVFAIYWLLRSHLKLQNLFVVLASYVFYGWWDYKFLLLIAFTSLCSYASGLLIQKSKITNDQSPIAKLWLWLNIVINLGILAVFKYYDFFVTEFITTFFAESVQPSLLHSFTLKIILPVGISFYTFQALSYSIDVYRSKIEPTRDPIAFFASVAFFPQLVAGPIERATNLLPQFQKTRTFDYAEAVEGCRRILWGLFKKMVIADNCAIYVDSVWKDYASQSGSTLVLAAILFAFQIYGDFSGYSDIAIGTAKLFGFNLRDNFLTPYFSRNVAEFWKRWHISLNTWFVDYVYIPLGGSRPVIAKSEDLRAKSLERKIRLITIRNTFVIFLLSGLWHGANWTYVGWGAYHALLFVPLIWLGATKKYRDTATWKHIPQMVLTFGLVVLGWIIFRAPSIADAWQYVVAICDKSLLSVPWLINRQLYIPLLISILLLFLFEWKGRGKGYGLAWLRGKRGALQLAVYYLFLILIYVWQSSEDIQFIYFQF